MLECLLISRPDSHLESGLAVIHTYTAHLLDVFNISACKFVTSGVLQHKWGVS